MYALHTHCSKSSKTPCMRARSTLLYIGKPISNHPFAGRQAPSGFRSRTVQYSRIMYRCSPRTSTYIHIPALVRRRTRCGQSMIHDCVTVHVSFPLLEYRSTENSAAGRVGDRPGSGGPWQGAVGMRPHACGVGCVVPPMCVAKKRREGAGGGAGGTQHPLEEYE